MYAAVVVASADAVARRTGACVCGITHFAVIWKGRKNCVTDESCRYGTNALFLKVKG